MSGEPRPELVLAAHLPLLRIDADSVAYAGGDLWRMPFEVFDVLTMGAFTDHRQSYDSVAPVFYRLVVRPALPNLVRMPGDSTETRSMQLKLPNGRYEMLSGLGLDVLRSFHDLAVDPAWTALLMETHAAAFPSPRWSASFAIADEGWGLAVGDNVSRIVSLQGDADMEYLMVTAFAVPPVNEDVLQRASARADALANDKLLPPVVAAATALAQCSSPLLRPSDQATLATVALEALLLPELRSGLERTLARRTGALLARHADETAELERLARTLYDIRSASLHGEASPADAEAIIADHRGPGLLAAAALALQARHDADGGGVEDLLTSLDGGHARADNAGLPGRSSEWPHAARQPLMDDRVSVVAIGGTNLESQPDTFLLWAPLVRLRARQPLAFGDANSPLVVPLSGDELLRLEERDIARDFAAAVRLLPEDIAALAIQVPRTEVSDDERLALERLEQERDLAVTALRLAGLRDFIDPALAGAAMMRQSIRYRRPTVLRQSVWQRLKNPDGHRLLLPADGEAIRESWQLLQRYRATAGHPDIERALALYRRVFDGEFTSADTIGSLQFTLLEALLGRFPAPTDPDRMEDSIRRLPAIDRGAVQWFDGNGRGARNDLAHGRGSQAMTTGGHDAMMEVLRRALMEMLRLWPGVSNGNIRPARLLMKSLRTRE